MAATSHGGAWKHCSMHNVGDKASRMYELDRTSFSIEDELKNVPINVISQ